MTAVILVAICTHYSFVQIWATSTYIISGNAPHMCKQMEQDYVVPQTFANFPL